MIRFLALLSLAIWLGAIFFFALMAPTVFAVLPTNHQLAGEIISPLLEKLHWVGASCGVLFLILSMTSNQLRTGAIRPFRTSHLLVTAMLGLLAISQFGLAPRMLAMRNQMVVIDNVPKDDPVRVAFNDLHHWSTRLEGTVFVLGLGVLYITSRRLGARRE